MRRIIEATFDRLSCFHRLERLKSDGVFVRPVRLVRLGRVKIMKYGEAPRRC